MTDWDTEKRDREERLTAGRRYAKGKLVSPDDATKLMEAIVRPGDRVCLEGDNQKQADFLARALANADRTKLHDIHIVQSGIVLSEHLDLFEKAFIYFVNHGGSTEQNRSSHEVGEALSLAGLQPHPRPIPLIAQKLHTSGPERFVDLADHSWRDDGHSAVANALYGRDRDAGCSGEVQHGPVEHAACTADLGGGDHVHTPRLLCRIAERIWIWTTPHTMRPSAR